MLNMLTPKQQRWRKLWPVCSIALLATLQLVLTFIIIGLETTSIIFDFYHSMIFAGFYCSLFFMITWISMFTVTCCNRHSFGCATHVLVENILSIIAAAVLLYFDNLFLNNPYICLYGSTDDCNQSSSSYSYNNGIYNSTTYTVKLACIKAQLACAAVMLATNVIYIIIYIIVAVKTRNESNEAGILPYGTAPYYIHGQPAFNQGQPPTNVSSFPQEPPSAGQRFIKCPNCDAKIQMPNQVEPVYQPPVQVQPVYQPPVQVQPVYQPPVQVQPVYQPPVQVQPVYQPPVQVEPVYQPPIPVKPVNKPPIQVQTVYQPPNPAKPVYQPPNQVQPVTLDRSLNISEYETSWRSKFPKLPVLILSIIQFAFTIIIFILEIASLATFIYEPTGVGIWCAIPFLAACFLTFILVRRKDASRMWATRVLISQLVLIVFTLILIGITGNYVQTGGYISSNVYGSYVSDTSSSYNTKYHIIQAQLAFGILLMFSGFTYVGIYIYVTYVALWQTYHTLDTGHLFHE